eukprot:350093-Chlamydomonas_euryale.AAC.4
MMQGPHLAHRSVSFSPAHGEAGTAGCALCSCVPDARRACSAAAAAPPAANTDAPGAVRAPQHPQALPLWQWRCPAPHAAAPVQQPLRPQQRPPLQQRPPSRLLGGTTGRLGRAASLAADGQRSTSPAGGARAQQRPRTGRKGAEQRTWAERSGGRASALRERWPPEGHGLRG